MQSSNERIAEFARIRTVFMLVNLAAGLAAIAAILVLAVLV